MNSRPYFAGTKLSLKERSRISLLTLFLDWWLREEWAMFNSSMKMWTPMAASQMHSSLVFLRLSWSWRLTLTSRLSQQTNITEAKEIEVGNRYDHLGSPSSTRIFPGDPVQLTVSKAPAEERTIKSSKQPRKCGNTKDSSPETKLKVVKGSDLM